MVTLDAAELAKIIDAGLKGNANAFALLCRRLVSKLKKEDPQSAEVLLKVLTTTSAIRDASLKLPPPVDSDSRLNLLQESFPVALESEPLWSASVAGQFGRLIKERENSDRLISAGLEPIRSLLVMGPPGVGKTLSAQWLAHQLGLPLLTLDLATVMSSLLGKTGSNLRAVIDYARGFPCVLLLDEFDAVAKHRNDDRDVGELKRLVTVLLQAIDDWPATSLLIAATNHPEMLDRAVWRRFDIVMNLDNPSPELVNQYLRREGISEKLSRRLSSVIKAASFADLTKLVQAARKDSILENRPLEVALVQKVLSSVNKDEKGQSRDLRVLLYHLQGLSKRKIAEQVGVTHPTVSKILDQFE